MEKQERLERLRKSKKYNKFTDDQWECCKTIFDLVGGEHHLQNDIKSFGMGIAYNTMGDFSTFDFNTMTLAVFMAHDRCIRLSVHNSTRKMIKLCLWKRHSRKGTFSEKHPTIEEALKEYREYYPKLEK